MLAEMLRQTPQLLHLRAEVNPFFVLSGLSHPESATDSDALDARSAAGASAEALDRLLARDVGVVCDDAPALERFFDEVAVRLRLQWPEEVFDRDRVASLARQIAAEVDPRTDVSRFHVRLLEALRPGHPALNAWFYDIADDVVAREAPELARPLGAPGTLLVEEPPFVTIRPWRLAAPADLQNRPLIVKTPSNAYRLEFLRAFFPNARFRVLHLLRSAPAAVNGLVDGWRYRGFHAHRLERRLEIAGYAEALDDEAARWWKYDLPPGWRAHTSEPLIDVCAFQWRSAHDAVLRFLDAHRDVDRLRLRFDELVGSPTVRESCLRRLCDWLGITLDTGLRRVLDEGLPPVMATSPPRQRRWFERADMLERVLRQPQVRETMERLGYGEDPQTWP